MIQKIWDKYVLRALSWTYENSFLAFCILGLAFLLSLIVAGCTTKPDLHDSWEPHIGERATIQIVNEMDVFYTVKIHISDTWEENHVIDSADKLYIKLPLRNYRVCISREFDIEETCVDKTVSGDDIWKIRRK